MDLEEFGLIYPITIEDVVNEWEAISYLYHHLFDLGMLRLFPPMHSRVFGADSVVLEIEAIHMVESNEIIEDISRRSQELGTERRTMLEILLLAGSAERFYNIIERMERERITVEEVLRELQE